MSEIVIELKSHINELQFSVELRTANHKQSVGYSLAAVARFLRTKLILIVKFAICQKARDQSRILRTCSLSVIYSPAVVNFSIYQL